ncbi:peroxisomal membrane protein [Lentinula edodes]|uniref:Peroxisomal membrane protein n=1 Tax=Lentinula edodes TaxID=5353 RepID=A0A1Q3EG38_LENED|nr:peroxisomal membrane protein [Lentinula edodes]
MAVSPSSGPWITLKTLLFSIIMISDSILSACLYIPPTDYRLSPTSSLSSPASLSLTTLLTLFRLSFVVSQFGGISSMGGGEEASFKEMRKAAYLALDILASGPEDVSERFIDELMAHRVSVYPGSQELGHPQTIVEKGLKPPVEQIIELAKISFALSCIEQLVPVLSIKYLKGPVWNLVEPNLDLRHSPPGTSEASSSSPNYTTQQLMDQLMRETFESAHSVVLAILAANATNADLKGPGVSGSNDGKGKAREEEDLSLSDFCTRLVPFYSRCLIQNSAEGKLSTSQLRIAYAALVRSACSSVSPTRYESDELSQYTLAWYCISKLLSAIQNLGNDIPDLEQKHRLHITFIACVSALPLSLLGRFFEEIDGVLRVDRESKNSENMAALTMQDQNRTELIQALYRELSQMVGDREKEYVLRWWSAFAAENTIAPNRRTISKL